MATDDYEAVDLSKKKLVEEILAEERDDAIIRVARLRKRQPPKLRSKARNIVSNIIHYHSKVCVNAGASTELLSSLTDSDDLCNTYIPQNFNILSTVITECVDERKELMKVRRQLLSSLTASNPKSKMKGKHRFPYIISPHMYSTDFIVDENMVS